jgi:hypothetical protein
MRIRSVRQVLSAAAVLAVALSACAGAEPTDPRVLVEDYLESHGADRAALWPVVAGGSMQDAPPTLSSVVLLDDRFAYRADLGIPVGGPVLQSVPVCVGVDPESAKDLCGLTDPLPPQVHESRHGELFVYIFGPDTGITFSPEISRSPFSPETDVYTKPLGGKVTPVSASS